ncbi:chromosome partitioning protein ParB [Bacteroidia bacterium]|nr:chromosome partitioning protein ParB [Bacteroidia bacterium]
MKKIDSETIQNISLSMIACSPYNPRKYRREEDLEELAKSIANFGIIQPVTLRPAGDRYEIVCGERRYRASMLAGLTAIPSIVKPYSDGEAMEITILENLQRKDISPVEEAVSFGRLMEIRGYTIDELCRQFGKSDKYVRSRLQLRNLVEEVSGLLLEGEITLGIALEISRFCREIQLDVYREHLSAGNSYASWKQLSANDFRRSMENGYCTDLSKYHFDKGDCAACPLNSAMYDLFSDGNCGRCQDSGCLGRKQREYMARAAAELVDAGTNIGVCVTPHSNASQEVAAELSDKGCEVYEMYANPYPEKPAQPMRENYNSEEEFQEAVTGYDTELSTYQGRIDELDRLEDEGKIQKLVDISKLKPEVCFRTLAMESPDSIVEDPVGKLREQDRRYREIAVEKTVEEVKQLLHTGEMQNSEFTEKEEDIICYLMLSDVRKEHFGKLGYPDERFGLSPDQKTAIISSLTVEQKNMTRRDFIVRHISDTFGNTPQSLLLLDFAAMHFPEKVAAIKARHAETYRQRNRRITEKIALLESIHPKPQAIEPAAAMMTVSITVKPGDETVSDSSGSFDEFELLEDTPLAGELPVNVTIGETSCIEEEFVA